ncbi:Protein ABHD1 [Portunus trituberculatus]|uniref:Protein ABHD1 n=1 Tax=Portunus trituberculatus TaxID=210409 RepID=A0A5B7CGJ0_PORTR|nr:Protein ABHD1 [Portunus trituberculatus]
MRVVVVVVYGIPVEEAKKSSHVAIVVTSRGGHIGFMEGIIPTNTYYSDRLYKQLVSSVFSNLEQLGDVRNEAQKYATEVMCSSAGVSGDGEGSSSVAGVSGLQQGEAKSMAGETRLGQTRGNTTSDEGKQREEPSRWWSGQGQEQNLRRSPSLWQAALCPRGPEGGERKIQPHQRGSCCVGVAPHLKLSVELNDLLLTLAGVTLVQVTDVAQLGW